jgi:outer membrane lipoprotein
MIRLLHPLLRTAFLLIATIPIAGCARPFSEEALVKVNRSVSFPDLKNDPEKYKGILLLLAGVIVGSKNTKEGTFIEILQKPADHDGRPLETDATEGRFIVQSERFLDTAIYHRGRELSVIAEVVGRKELPLDEIMSSYPLLAIKEVYLWEPSSGPFFFFGVDVMRRF